VTSASVIGRLGSSVFKLGLVEIVDADLAVTRYDKARDDPPDSRSRYSDLRSIPARK
jgi:hypothetical protein